MAFSVKLLKRAELEVDEAIVYYKDIQPKLAERFLTDYENQLKTLNTIPYFGLNTRKLERFHSRNFRTPFIFQLMN